MILTGWLSVSLVLGDRAQASIDRLGDVARSPTALVAGKDGRSLFVACASANEVLRIDAQTRKVTATFTMPSPPNGLAISGDGSKLFITFAATESWICVVDVVSGKMTRRMRVGDTVMAPVLCPDNQTLLVCNRFDNDVRVIDLGSGQETGHIQVQREPVAATLSSKGKYLLVANMLPTGRADAENISAAVSVVDWTSKKVVKELPLPDGSFSLNDIRTSPDGKFALVTHILARYHLPATDVERGWMNANALSIIDLTKMEILNTVLLDDVEQGAANPWGIAWSADSRTAVVTHAGTHEVSIIDFPKLLAKLSALPTVLKDTLSADYGTAARVQADVPNDLTFLVSLRKRVKLSATDRGPRAVAIIGNQAYVANYFSDTLSVVDISSSSNSVPVSIPLGPPHALSTVRQGELDFNDATLCHQGWQSCASCHPGDARMDALNWDLPNEGLGHPKNTKSLLLAHLIPSAMSKGVSGSSREAVRSALKDILFTEPREEVVTALDEYIKSLRPVPSPYLVQGKLSEAARRGEQVFSKAGCADCHAPSLYTDLQSHDVGTRSGNDGPKDKFYTPTLIESWRTAPYLHDGSAATIRDVLTTRNPKNGRHGDVAGLSNQEIDDLCQYVLSL
jgi:YVTN family beta-propeller protein